MKTRMMILIGVMLAVFVGFHAAPAQAQLFADYIVLDYDDPDGFVGDNIPNLTDPNNSAMQIEFSFCSVRTNSDGLVRATITTGHGTRYWDVDYYDDVYAIPPFHETPTANSRYSLEWLNTPTGGDAIFDMWIDEY